MHLDVFSLIVDTQLKARIILNKTHQRLILQSQLKLKND